MTDRSLSSHLYHDPRIQNLHHDSRLRNLQHDPRLQNLNHDSLNLHHDPNLQTPRPRRHGNAPHPPHPSPLLNGRVSLNPGCRGSSIYKLRTLTRITKRMMTETTRKHFLTKVTSRQIYFLSFNGFHRFPERRPPAHF